jgi:DNA-binding transcriptional MerR regulator
MEGKLIGEVAREMGVRAGTLRYYETLRLLPAPQRSASGYRLYDGEARQWLVFIANAKSLGLTLREIRQIITVRGGGRLPCDSVRAMLSDHVREIDRHIVRLRMLKSELLAIVRSSDPQHRRGVIGSAVCPLIETAPRARHRIVDGGTPR